MSDQRPGVSARGVLDGEADALAGLCDSRGPSVVGYCACVCGPERAVEAAAAAFAAFRAGAVRAADPLSIDPEALLLGRTRAAAAQRVPKPAVSFVFAEVPCSQIPALLAERATGSSSPADEDRLRQHLARCAACQATQAVQEEAERSYFHPAVDAVDPVDRLEIIDALRRAVPPPTRNGRTVLSPNGDRPESAPTPEIQQATVGPARPRIPQPLPRTAAVTGSNLTSTPAGQPRAAGPAGGPPPPEPSNEARAPVPVEVIRRSTIAGGVVAPPESPGSRSPAGDPRTEAADADYGAAGGGGPAAEWDSPTGVMSVVDLDAAVGHDQGGVDFASQAGWEDARAAGADPNGLVDAGAPGADPSGNSESRSDRRRRTAPAFATTGVSRITVPRVLGPVAVLVVGLVVALFVAGVFNGGGSRAPAASSVSGGQTDPSANAPSGGAQTSGSSVIGGGSTGAGAVTGNGSTAASTEATAASRAAAKKRATAVARKLRAAGGAGAAQTDPSRPTTSANGSSPTQVTTGTRVTSPSAGSRASGPTGGAPAAKPTKPSSATSRPVTVHELGAGAGSAPPVSGIPATGATGYQPG